MDINKLDMHGVTDYDEVVKRVNEAFEDKIIPLIKRKWGFYLDATVATEEQAKMWHMFGMNNYAWYSHSTDENEEMIGFIYDEFLCVISRYGYGVSVTEIDGEEE